ncbi:MAG: AAA family ATPase [Microthrixaceae bacterium]|nr:AAA family ATPase [Microthrixaceae bacterium]
MEPAQFLTAPRVTIVAGKGGVGKTTTAVALGMAASSVGLRALLVEVEGKSAIGSLFGVGVVGYEEVELIPPGRGEGGLRARALTPDDALVEFLQDHGLKRVSNRLVSSGALDMVVTATPGIKDVLILGKVKQLERAGTADVIILDAPAAGHAITFLRSAQGLLDAVKVGLIESQAREVCELLADPTRCQVVLVTLPEETPVNELTETAFSLEDQVGVSLGPVVVNGAYPLLDGLDTDPEQAAREVGANLKRGEAESLALAANFRLERSALQQVQISRLRQELPLPQLHLPFVFTSQLTREDLASLADILIDEIGALK